MRENKTGFVVDEQEADKIKSLFRKGIAELGVDLSEQSITGLVQYLNELIKWNRKVNLIAKKTSIDDIIEKHFLDSLTLVPILEKYVPEGRLLDVGSGAGFPGLVIKTACPDRPVTLLEPRQRRVSFLKHIIRTLQLTDIDVLEKRTDEIAFSSDTPYGIITGRAVADVNDFLKMIYDIAEPETVVVCMQGATGKEQWEGEKDNQLFARLGLENVHLPFSKVDRMILLFKKNRPFS